MTDPRPDGPAKVVGERSLHNDAYIPDPAIELFGQGIVSSADIQADQMVAEEIAGKINRALVPLVSKAEAAERLAECLMLRHARNEYWHTEPKEECDICLALAAWETAKNG